jgi:hypothetical protein
VSLNPSEPSLDELLEQLNSELPDALFVTVSELPRVDRVSACTPEQCICAGCGKETVVIGHEESEQLDVEPAKYFVGVIKREKRACKNCEELGVLAAPLPPRIIEKSLVSDRVVVPLAEALRRELIRGTYAEADETPVSVHVAAVQFASRYHIYILSSGWKLFSWPVSHQEAMRLSQIAIRSTSSSEISSWRRS